MELLDTAPRQKRTDEATRPHITRAMAGLSLQEDEVGSTHPAIRLSRMVSLIHSPPILLKQRLALPDEWFSGKYVLIGTNIAGVDQFRTPFTSDD